MPILKGHANQGGREGVLSAPSKSSSPLRVGHRNQGLGKAAPPGRRDLRAGERQGGGGRGQAQGPRGYLRRGSGEPSAHAPSLADPSARTDARRRGARGSATSVLTGSEGIMRHRQTARCPPGAQGVLSQVPAAPTAPLPCRPRTRGIRCVSAALDLLPGPVPLAFVARQQSEGFR